jgi:hypothetical protein
MRNSRRVTSRTSLEDQLNQLAQKCRELARELDTGPEKSSLLERAQRIDVALHSYGWVKSPRLSPK